MSGGGVFKDAPIRNSDEDNSKAVAPAVILRPSEGWGGETAEGPSIYIPPVPCARY